MSSFLSIKVTITISVALLSIIKIQKVQNRCITNQRNSFSI